MNIGKILVLAAFAAAIVALFTTEKGKEIREELEDTAEDWGEVLGKLIDKASCSVNDLQKLVAKEIGGLTDEARQRIQAIIDESVKTARKVKDISDAQLN